MARTVVNDTTSRVLLASDLPTRSGVRIANRSTERLSVFTAAADPVAFVEPFGTLVLGPEYTGPIYGAWARDGAGHALIADDAFWFGSQSEYDSLGSYDGDRLYVIVP